LQDRARAAAAFAMAWDRMIELAMLVDPEARLVAANGAAEAALAAGAPAALTDGVVTLSGPADNEALVEALSRRSPSLLILGEMSGRDSGWRVRVSPLGDVALVTIHRLGDPSQAHVVDFAGSFSLTKSERRIVTELAANKDMAEIAERFGITVETVRTHTKRIFAKIGVKSRADLSALLFPTMS
jgi:DNA-binding CsgD family transcriptional regulator